MTRRLLHHARALGQRVQLGCKVAELALDPRLQRAQPLGQVGQTAIATDVPEVVDELGRAGTLYRCRNYHACLSSHILFDAFISFKSS
jgi:hypothetical protein